jgi:hypothetical protein
MYLRVFIIYDEHEKKTTGMTNYEAKNPDPTMKQIRPDQDPKHGF